MNPTLNDLQQWMGAPSETEHLEFKAAENQFDFEKLLHYCCALTNEGGDSLILGVTNQLPRQVVGTKAFPNLEPIKRDLYQRLRFRVQIEKLRHAAGRVLVFQIPSRPMGQPLRVDRIYWMRAGESLTEMSEDRLRAAFAEGQPDFSAEICAGAGLGDLAPEALEDFRRRWMAKSGNRKLAQVPAAQLLADAELSLDGQLTYAALILLGRRPALTRWLASAEVIFEYRSSEGSISHQQREEFREGLFLQYDKLWSLLNLRNDLQHYQDGLFVWDIPTFNERVAREAILNAVCHRDYRASGSIFVRQFPQKLQVVSPGGWPEGVTAETVIYRQKPRNRRLAEALSRCGLVERAGQGYDEIFTLCVKESKPLPEFTQTDDYQVSVTLNGIVQDAAFLRFLSKVGEERQRSFGVEDFLVLDLLRRECPVPEQLAARLQPLREAGAIELLSRGRGARYILSKKFYDFSGRRGAYTRKRGLDQETNKELIIQHLKNHQKGTISEFEEVLPALRRSQIHWILTDLKSENRIVFCGARKSGHWELPT